VYVASPDQIRGAGFWTPETRGFVMPADRSVDVDTVLDLAMARTVSRRHGAPTIGIAGRTVGPGYPCFVIAEAGVNHNGSLDLALRLVGAAAEAGANAVKFQTFRADKTATRLAPKAEYQKRTTGASESQFEMLKRLELSPQDHVDLAAHCLSRGVTFLSSPFDEESADLLEGLGVPAFKVPSGELTNLPFLRYLARKRRPLIISTGMATLAEVEAAVAAVKAAGCDQFSLLHCVSNYPAAAADVNLRAMATMATAFDVPVGYSDHTLGPHATLGAVALGACIIEKHFTLDRSLPGPDHQASAEPAEFAALVSGIRMIEEALGNGEKRPAAAELETARVARRSLVAAETIPEGSRLTLNMVTARRPGTGLPADRVGELLGRRALGEVPAGTILTLDMFAS
jgi:N-acetylneuraminate synthase